MEMQGLLKHCTGYEYFIFIDTLSKKAAPQK